MAEFEVLIKLLAVQLGENSNLRDALVQTMFAFIGEETQRAKDTARLSYLDLLEQIEEQRLQAEKDGKSRISAALNILSEQLRDELHQSALSLHEFLCSSQIQPNEEHIQRVGIAVKNFPVGFPKNINLLELSESYLKAARDLYFLEKHFPGRLPDITKKITEEKQSIAPQIQEVVWEALSTGLFTDIELLNLHSEYLNSFHNQRIEAENKLSTLLTEMDSSDSATSRHNIETWLRKFGSPSWTILKELPPKHKKVVLELLLRIPDYVGLEALMVMEPGEDEKDRFNTLMTLRFGREFRDFMQAWKSWLKRGIDKATQREQAISFWKEYPYSIPAILVEQVPPLTHPWPLPGGELEIPESLHVKMLEEMGEIGLEELLESRRSIMIEDEIRIIEVETLTFDIKEIQRTPEQPTEVHPPVPPSKEEKESPTSPLVEGVVETAMDYAIEGNLLESAIVTVIDRGAERLTVTIEEDEEGSQQEKKPTPAHLEEEPAESIWQNYIFPFVRENLAVVLAASMIFTGLLVLEFYFWDKAAGIRYGLTPLMIVGVSFFLSRFGIWLKGEDIQSEIPIVIVQSVSILLAPMSLLFVALLSVDRELSLLIRIIGGLLLFIVLLGAWSYVFVLAIRTVYRAMAGIHSRTLLLLNALLVLLPIAQWLITSTSLSTGSSGVYGRNLWARTILVIGFYVGFLVLCWSVNRVLGKMLAQGESSSRVPMTFYSVTCLGTFALVWGLTHARLMLLPQPYTYGPLLLLFSFLISMVEFKLLGMRTVEETGETPVLPGEKADETPARPRGVRITSLSYTAYFFIGLGVLLSIGHDYIRVVALLLAGLVWLYQALKLRQYFHSLLTFHIKGEEPALPSKGDYAARHFNISMVILTGAFSSIALIRDFPAPFFPYLALLVVSGLFVVSRMFPFKAASLLTTSLSPIYLSFTFIISILWQWAEHIHPLSYGVAFMLFGLCSIYLGAKIDRLIHIHAGAGYIVAALAYLGFVDMSQYTMEGNTLVFGLALVGILWVLASSTFPNSAIRDSRSTVLWNIGILAFCIMCVRVIFKETLDISAGSFLQFQILTGPVIIGGLMLLAGYFTQSYVPVYLGLVVLVIIFPEIKDRFNIPMYSGMGSTMSGIGFLLIVLMLRLWKRLHKSKKNDLIWRKKVFPFQAKNYYLLFANPIVVAAFFLFTRTIFSTYPTNYFRPLFPFAINTTIAVLLCGTAYHFFSIWTAYYFSSIRFWKTWFSYIFSYIGFITIFFGIIHSFYVDTGLYSDEIFLPLYILIAFMYCEGVCVVCSKILPVEKARLITRPFRHLQYIVIWISVPGFYIFYNGYYTAFYQTSFFPYWLPLLLYLCGASVWLAWKIKRSRRSWFSLLPAYLLFWQLVILVTTRGDLSSEILRPHSGFYLNTSLMVLGIVSIFFLFEHILTKEKFRRLSPLLWTSLVFLLVFSPFLVTVFYDIMGFFEFPHLIPQIIVWALVSFVLGRFLNLGLLWLWSVFLIYPLFVPSMIGYFHPFTFACVAIVLSGLNVMTNTFNILYEHKYSYTRAQNRFLSPPFLFAVTSQIVVFFTFLQAFPISYCHKWMTIIGLFLSALPALLSAHQLGFSRRFLCSVPYTLAWIALMLAIQKNFPENPLLIHLKTTQIISCGLFGALLTMVLNEYFWRAIHHLPKTDTLYRALKYAAGLGVIFLIILSYLATRNIELISWQWLLISGILSLGAGLYFRYFEEESHKL